MGGRPQMTPERFWDLLDRSDPNGCWLWTRHRHAGGYGRFHINRKWVLAHRYAYTIAIGPLDADVLVCHRCDTPPCCNPAHLFAGTVADNNNDKRAKGRDRYATGEAHGLHKLTTAQVAELRNAYAAGEGSQRALARRFEISQASAWAILTNQTRRAG